MRMRLFCAAAAALTLMAGNFSKAADAEKNSMPPVMRMSASLGLFDSSSASASGALATGVQAELDKFLGERKPASEKRDWEIKADGKIDFDKNLWSASKDSDGGEVFTSKKTSGSTSEIKRSVIRNEDQSIRTVSEYRVAKDKTENFCLF